ncbi:MAG TPA: ATP-dependent helicase, partial [Terriglobales bacterium]|nr:ATP-dependent helicase [Terriglobales bacterium]
MSSEEKSKRLTPQQQQAVEHVQGPVMVIAGAGCGKTLVLTHRIAHLIRSGICRPDEILAVTFTINAAAEIRERVQKLLPDIDVSKLKGQTFHAYCADVLAKAKQKFKIVEDNDLNIYLRKHIEDLPLKIFTRAASPGQFIEQLMRFNSRCQDELVSAHNYFLFVEELKRRPLIQPPRVMKSSEMDGHSREDFIARCEEIAAIYSHVTKLLRDNGWGTFGDMLQQTVTLLKRSAPRLEEERQRCKYILIDEFQDSNFAQIELASLLGGETANIFVVGDPDQAIYKFRGATSGAFEEFRQRYPQCKIVTLSDNYRSTPAILKCAHAVIATNPRPSFGREPLEAKGETREVSAPVELLVSPTDVEAYAIAETIERTQAEMGGRWSEFAVLYKNNDHREAVLAELEAREIPVQVVGADLTDTTALRDLLSAARVVVRPDDSVALMRVAAFSQFTIDPAELKRAMANA